MKNGPQYDRTVLTNKLLMNYLLLFMFMLFFAQPSYHK